MKRKWMAILQIAATYIGTVVGAGFATGKEIMEFFTRFGLLGFLGILISGLLFMIIGTKMMLLAHQIQAYSYQEFNDYLFGKRVGAFVNGLTMIILFGVTSVMLSGTGSIFEEQLGVPYQLGILFTLLITFTIMIKGLDGVLGINSLVVPLMVFFSFILLIPIVNHNIQLNFTHISINSSQWPAFINPFLYVSFNLAMAQAVLVPLGKEIQDEKILKWGGILGGVGLLFMLLTSHLALSIYPNINQYDIPMAEVLVGFGKAIQYLFIFVIFGEIITTLVGNVFGLMRQIRTFIKLPENILVFLILAISYLISLIGFNVLLKYLYPLFGYVGLLLLLKISFIKIPKNKSI